MNSLPATIELRTLTADGAVRVSTQVRTKGFRAAWNEAVLKARRGERVLAVVKELYI
jgi:uncharacterized protein YjlB